ncbi:unnamed protein product [Discosporangium mesarthrocarpum]
MHISEFIAFAAAGLAISEAFVVPYAGKGATQVRQQRGGELRCAADSPASQSRDVFLRTSALATSAAVFTLTSGAGPSYSDEGEGGGPKLGEEVTTSSGLKFKVTKEGKGASPKPGDTIKTDYTGWLNGFDEDGVKFDSSRDRGRPFSFRVGIGQVIKAWDETLLDMKIGERRQITVPPELGYGSRGAGGIIPPNSTLYFDVELKSIG